MNLDLKFEERTTKQTITRNSFWFDGLSELSRHNIFFAVVFQTFHVSFETAAQSVPLAIVTNPKKKKLEKRVQPIEKYKVRDTERERKRKRERERERERYNVPRCESLFRQAYSMTLYANRLRGSRYHANFIPNLRCRFNTHSLPGGVILEEGNQYFQRPRDCSPHDFIVPRESLTTIIARTRVHIPVIEFMIYSIERRRKTKNVLSYLYACATSSRL